MNHKELIRTCYKLAKNAGQKGNHPFGALLVIDNKVVVTSENTVETDRDITQHAELRLISEASKTFTREQLMSAILYTSTEPCAMCTGAIFWSGVSNVIFGCSTQKLAELRNGSFVVSCEELFNKGNRDIKVTGPILEEEGASIIEDYWPSNSRSSK